MAFVTHTKGSSDLEGGLTWADNLEFIITTGDQVIDTNMDQSAYSITKAVVVQGFVGQVGKTTAPARFDVEGDPTDATAYLHYLADAGAMYWGGGNDGVMKNLTVNSERGKFYAIDGTITLASLVSGSLEIGASAVLTTLHMWGGKATLDYKASTSTTVYQYGGELTAKRNGTYWLFDDAKLIIDHTATPTIATNQRGTRTRVELINGDIASISRPIGTMDLTKAESDGSHGSTLHEVGPQGLAGMHYDTGRHTVATPTYLAAVNAGSPSGGAAI